MRLILIFAIVSIISLQSTTLSYAQAVRSSKLITYVTDPAVPGKLSVIVGNGWDSVSPLIKMMKFENAPINTPYDNSLITFDDSKAKTLRVVKKEYETLICDFPNDRFSVYAVSAKGKEGWSEPVIVNRAKVQWLSKETAKAGDIVRAIGRNLVNIDLYPQIDTGKPTGLGGYINNNKATTKILIQKPDGNYVNCSAIKQSTYDVHFVLPKNIETGKYKVYIHNGLGGRYGWSEPVELTVNDEKPWPTEIFNVKDFGGTGLPSESQLGVWHDDTEGIQKALDAAKVNGGGIVYLPAGNYYVTATLVIPEFTVLRGESRERSWIWYPDGLDHGYSGKIVRDGQIIDLPETPSNGSDTYFDPALQKVKVGLRGISNFTIENLSIHSVYTNVLIAAPLSRDDIGGYEGLDNARAKNVTVRNCYLAQEPTYRHHWRARLDTYFANQKLFEGLWRSSATISMRGDNIVVSDNWIRSGSMGVAYLACTYSTLARNTIFWGRGGNAFACRELGYPSHPQQQKLIFEDNVFSPVESFHTSAYWCHATSLDFFVARNKIQLTWGCDSEALLWHGAGPQQLLDVTSAKENTVTVSNKVDNIVNWECVVVKGKGLGQRRMVTATENNILTFDKPWQIVPDESSQVAVLSWPCHRDHIIVGNELSDHGNGIYGWGDTYNWIVDGNSMTRGGGVEFAICSFSYRPWSGNFFMQVLNNSVDQGRYMGKYHENAENTWTLGFTGTQGYQREMIKNGTIGDLAHIYRGNYNTNDASIAFFDLMFGKDDSFHNGEIIDKGMVVEENRFENCKFGINVGKGVSGVLRNNKFKNVETPLRIQNKAAIIQE